MMKSSNSNISDLNNLNFLNKNITKVLNKNTDELHNIVSKNFPRNYFEYSLATFSNIL